MSTNVSEYVLKYGKNKSKIIGGNMNQVDKNNEYNEFWVKFAKNAEEILREYDKLSLENKQKASMEAQRIILSQGVLGILEYGKNIR